MKVTNINIGIYYEKESGFSIRFNGEKYQWYPVKWNELVQVVIPSLFERQLIAPKRKCKK
jgi:hypothetical protein